MIHTAPIASTPSTQSVARRDSQATLGSLSSILIESSGTAASWAGNIVVWVTDAQGNAITETTGTATETNGIAINNPAFSQLSCGGANPTSSTWCAAHPNGWWFGTAAVLTKPIGQQTITITFGDGTTGTVTDDIFNGFSLPCDQSMAYQNGVPTIVAANVADFTYDCVNQQVTFPHGYTIAAQPQIDGVGRASTVIASVTSPVAAPTNVSASIPFASFVQNAVYVFGTSDGGTAKMLSGEVGAASYTGLSLKASSNGSFAY